MQIVVYSHAKITFLENERFALFASHSTPNKWMYDFDVIVDLLLIYTFDGCGKVLAFQETFQTSTERNNDKMLQESSCN